MKHVGETALAVYVCVCKYTHLLDIHNFILNPSNLLVFLKHFQLLL